MGFDGSLGKRRIGRLRGAILGWWAVWQAVSTVFSSLGEKARKGWPDRPSGKSKGDHDQGVGYDFGQTI
jgi:hypothetical protein